MALSSAVGAGDDAADRCAPQQPLLSAAYGPDQKAHSASCGVLAGMVKVIVSSWIGATLLAHIEVSASGSIHGYSPQWLIPYMSAVLSRGAPQQLLLSAPCAHAWRRTLACTRAPNGSHKQSPLLCAMPMHSTRSGDHDISSCLIDFAWSYTFAVDGP